MLQAKLILLYCTFLPMAFLYGFVTGYLHRQRDDFAPTFMERQMEHLDEEETDEAE